MYQKMIDVILRQHHQIGIDPRHVEAYMRLERGCLDELSPVQFRYEAKLAISCILSGGIEAAEKLAQSYGL